ncbi:MAG: hypothetical protein GY813_09300 [Halieaceae bacterium]|nr:hypothetical protein [Halieaceae bacterium]
MKRNEVLEAALELITQDREDQYGAPEKNFGRIAAFWSIHLGCRVTRADVGIMMTLLKIARMQHETKTDDNYIDAAGYIAIAKEMESK